MIYIYIALVLCMCYLIPKMVEFLLMRRLHKERASLGATIKQYAERQQNNDDFDRILAEESKKLAAAFGMPCAYRKRGLGCNLCYQAEVVHQRIGMEGVYCIVHDVDCSICTLSRPIPSCTKEFYNEPQEKGGETE